MRDLHHLTFSFDQGLKCWCYGYCFPVVTTAVYVALTGNVFPIVVVAVNVSIPSMYAVSRYFCVRILHVLLVDVKLKVNKICELTNYSKIKKLLFKKCPEKKGFLPF